MLKDRVTGFGVHHELKQSVFTCTHRNSVESLDGVDIRMGSCFQQDLDLEESLRKAGCVLPRGPCGHPMTLITRHLRYTWGSCIIVYCTQCIVKDYTHGGMGCSPSVRRVRDLVMCKRRMLVPFPASQTQIITQKLY